MTIDDLIRACDHGKSVCDPSQLDNVRKVLDSGVDINGRDGEGWTPLYTAASFAPLEVSKLL